MKLRFVLIFKISVWFHLIAQSKLLLRGKLFSCLFQWQMFYIILKGSAYKRRKNETQEIQTIQNTGIGQVPSIAEKTNTGKMFKFYKRRNLLLFHLFVFLCFVFPAFVLKSKNSHLFSEKCVISIKIRIIYYSKPSKPSKPYKTLKTLKNLKTLKTLKTLKLL